METSHLGDYDEKYLTSESTWVSVRPYCYQNRPERMTEKGTGVGRQLEVINDGLTTYKVCYWILSLTKGYLGHFRPEETFLSRVSMINFNQ